MDDKSNDSSISMTVIEEEQGDSVEFLPRFTKVSPNCIKMAEFVKLSALIILVEKCYEHA